MLRNKTRKFRAPFFLSNRLNDKYLLVTIMVIKGMKSPIIWVIFLNISMIAVPVKATA